MKLNSSFSHDPTLLSWRSACRTAAGLGAAVFFGGGSVQAALIAYEPFNYAAGSNLAGKGSWTASSGVPTVASAGLTYTDSNGNSLPTSGNAANLTNDGGIIALGGTYGGANGGIYYLSFLAQASPTASDNYFYMSTAMNTSTTTDFGKLNSAGSVNWTIRSTSKLPGFTATPVTTTPITQLSLIVLRLDYTSPTNAVFYMWVNPDLDSEPSLADADAAGMRVDTATFNGLRIQTNGNGIFDEIRFGTTYADVIPEPSALFLSLIGCSLMIRRKRSEF